MDPTYWSRAIQFQSSAFFGVFLAGHPELGATTLKKEIFNKNIYGNYLSLYLALKFRAKLRLKKFPYPFVNIEQFAPFFCSEIQSKIKAQNRFHILL